MSTTLTIRDESLSGRELNTFTLRGITERVTLREIIRARIYEEVQDYNRDLTFPFRGLVQPVEAETALNGIKPGQRRAIDWEKQFDLAQKPFLSNGFIVLVGYRQLEDLDEEIDLAVEDECSFVKSGAVTASRSRYADGEVLHRVVAGRRH